MACFRREWLFSPCSLSHCSFTGSQFWRGYHAASSGVRAASRQGFILRPIQKSNKLADVCYDIRGPVLEKSRQMEEEGHKITKLNIGNLAVFGFDPPDGGEWGRAATQDLIRSRIKIKSLNFMRGRTFVNKFLIIDEAQNLTPKQVKTLVTRAGPGTKILCLGNIAQIDTPYLTEGSSGLTYVVDRFKGWTHSGHVTLARGERSRLADHASEVL
jgi:predicted ribonuclease YlaK